MKRLYRVEFSGACYVMASSAMMAEYEAAKACADPGGACLETISDEVKPGHEVPDNWRDALPYGASRGEPERTVGEILEEMEVTK